MPFFPDTSWPGFLNSISVGRWSQKAISMCTLLVKWLFSHYLRQVWKQSQSWDILGNLEILAKTCPGKMARMVSLAKACVPLNNMNLKWTNRFTSLLQPFLLFYSWVWYTVSHHWLPLCSITIENIWVKKCHISSFLFSKTALYYLKINSLNVSFPLMSSQHVPVFLCLRLYSIFVISDCVIIPFMILSLSGLWTRWGVTFFYGKYKLCKLLNKD